MSPEPPSAGIGLTPDQLVEQYLGFVSAISKKILKTLPSFVELEDLEGFGMIGLVESSRRFDATRGVQFKTFAYYRIRGAVYDGIRKMAWFDKEPDSEVTYQSASNEILSESAAGYRSDQGPMDVEEEIGGARETIVRLAGARLLSLDHESMGEIADSAQSPEEIAALSRVVAALKDCVRELDDKERSVIENYYFQHMTLEDAGAKLGLSKSWTSRVHARALKSLEALCRKRGLEAPP